jgi:hypothetical protein
VIREILTIGDARDEQAAAGSVATFQPLSSGLELEVTTFFGTDGALVVQIDTHDVDRLRININDGTVYDRDIETDHDYGDDL